MQAAAGLVSVVVKLSARMKGCKNHALCGNALFVQLHRNSPAVVPHRTGAVRLQRHLDLRAVARQMLIHGVVHNFIDQVV